MTRTLPHSFAALCAARLVLGADHASAAPPELLSQLALHPTDPGWMALAYVQGGQGLLFSSDGGRSFALRCGAAVSPSFTRSRSPLAMTVDGALLLGTFDGLVQGGADGCGFAGDADVGLAGVQIADFAPHPSDPAISFIATANPSAGARTGIVRREADGSLFALGANDTDSESALAMTRLAVAALPDGRLRFVATALATDAAGEVRPILRYSDDEAATWQRHDVPGAEGARVLLLGVDPTDPERMAIALSRADANDEVLVTEDAGRSFATVLELFEVGAAAVAPDGRLWVGDAGGDAEYSQPGGLYRFEGFGAAPQKLATYPVRCLGYRALDGSLFGCQRSTFGSIQPESGVFSVSAGLSTVASFVACGAEALAPVCKAQLCDNWCGVLHYASAPVCDAYAEDNPLCGPAARGYAQASPSAGDSSAAVASDGATTGAAGAAEAGQVACRLEPG
ncbi:MAG TPA: hypothetical protein VNN80_33280, partial [Polyangiaceae bacterium]|nr:hypothetical protein [Polyangiaceae bacterium]